MRFNMLGPAPRILGLHSFGETFINVLDGADTRSVCLAVAYIHSGAVETVGQRLANVLRHGGNVEAVAGIQNSSARALRDFARIIGANNLSLYWQKGQGKFHPKLYIVANHTELGSATKMNIFVGSSNLTGAGLEYNLEMNVHIELSDPEDSVEMREWEARWALLRRLPGIHPYSDPLIKKLAERGAFSPSRPSLNLEDLLPTPVTQMPVITSITTTYVQTLLPNDFPETGESDAIIPRAARNANPQFWGWPNRFRLSPGGHPQRIFPNTRIQFGSQVIRASCRLYEVESVANFRLSCTAVRTLLPYNHEGYILTFQKIGDDDCQIRFLSPDDDDYQDFFLATCPLTNSPKRWGYV